MTRHGSTVVILTGSDDPTADAVISELLRRNAAVYRFDLADFPLRADLAAIHEGQQWRGAISIDDGSVLDIESVISVYYRRPSRFRFAPEMSAADRAFAEEEARIGVGGVLSALNCRWVSHPHSVARAEWKPLQLQVASAVGLSVPRTLISNSVTAARGFIRSATGPVVCKALSATAFSEGGAYKITYTTVVDEESLEKESFEATTHLLQEWVPKSHEARVTVVGDQLLATTIVAASERARIDWRADYDNLRYSPIEVPSDIAPRLRAYLAKFNLLFGAFDFVITPDGDWVMLECNPNGQWLWLHHMANLPIPAALADLLARPSRPLEETGWVQLMTKARDPQKVFGCDIDGWEELNRTMVDRLAASGLVDDRRWRAAFRSTPRHLFVPRFIRRSQVIDCANPATFDQWRDAIYTDTSLIVQTAPAPHYDSELPTSSSTMPSLMARMLHLLEIDDDGGSILEIGTATGYNTAILCHRLGGDRVTTIELHPELAALARQRLAILGSSPTVVCGNGSAGYSPNAPYDRILATCATNRIPAAWIRQLDTGGRIVVDLRAEMSSSLAVLQKTAPDRVEGPLIDFPGYFMWLRPDAQSPLLDPTRSELSIDRSDDTTDTSITSHDPDLLRDEGLRVALSALEPTLRIPLWLTNENDGTGKTYFFYSDDGSWCEVTPAADSRYTVTQGGPRHVWNSVARAINRWRNMGYPGRSRYGLTATADGIHQYWVDRPTHLLYPQ